MNAVVTREEGSPAAFDTGEVLRQKELVQKVMKAVMHKDEHYGVIPGTDKPTLYKGGAEILKFTFRLAAEYAIERTDLPGGHREYQVIATIRHIGTGSIVASGVGVASTMESKYRYRRAEAESTGKPVPKAYWDAKNANRIAEAQEMLGGKGFSPKKIDGAWIICKRSEDLVENPNLADTYNTVLKIAKKRADVDGTISATAASDIFSQDLEDLKANAEMYQESHDMEQPPPSSSLAGNGAKASADRGAAVPASAAESATRKGAVNEASPSRPQSSNSAAPSEGKSRVALPYCPSCGKQESVIQNKKNPDKPKWLCWAKAKTPGCGTYFNEDAAAADVMQQGAPPPSGDPHWYDKAIAALEAIDVTADNGARELKAAYNSKGFASLYQRCSEADQQRIIAKHDELQAIAEE